MFKSYLIYALILFAPLTALADSLGPSSNQEQPLGIEQIVDLDVPISPLAHIYAKRTEISFEVCSGGVFLDAAREAAKLWNRDLTGRIEIKVVPSACANNHGIRNGRSELHYGEPGTRIQTAVGLYQGILDRQREVIVEEDITIDSDIDDLVFLTNIITHEFGHALGINHALGVTCRESVMAEYACRNYPTPPTSADIEAAKKIYRFVKRTISDFDLNRNNQIDEQEFFSALDQWLSNQIEDILFFQLIDLWINNRSIKAEEQKQFNLLSASHIELYDLSGKLIGLYSGKSLQIALKSLPRETYLYRAYWNGAIRIGKIQKS